VNPPYPGRLAMDLPWSEASPVLKNPFFHRGPVRDRRYFFGRTRETRQVLEMLCNGQCVSIVGPRRVGKTSHLFHFCDPEMQKRHGLPEKYILVYIDGQGRGNLDVPHFYQWIWEETRGVLAMRGETDDQLGSIPELHIQVVDEDLLKKTPWSRHLPRLRQILTTRFDEGELQTLCHDLGVRYDALPGEGMGNKARELVDYFQRRGAIPELVRVGKQLRPDIAWGGALGAAEEAPSTLPGHPSALLKSEFKGFRKVLEKVQEGGYTLVFLFDEFDALARNPNLDQDLFSDLRRLVPDVVYVTASQGSLYDLTYADDSVLSSPFFNVFEEVCLGFLMPEEAEEMVLGLLEMTGQGNPFSERDLAFVFEMGGYHPFFLQLAGYHLFEQKIDCKELTRLDYSCTRQRYAESAEAHFRYAWDHLEEGEEELLHLVSEGRVNQLSDYHRRRLQRKCILYSDVFFSPVFADFVQRQLTEKAGAVETHGQGTRKVQSIWRWLVRSVRTVGSALQSADGKPQKSG
jgi:hypothetical protein